MQSEKHWQVGADHDLACPRAAGRSELGLTRIGDRNANEIAAGPRHARGASAGEREEA